VAEEADVEGLPDYPDPPKPAPLLMGPGVVPHDMPIHPSPATDVVTMKRYGKSDIRITRPQVGEGEVLLNTLSLDEMIEVGSIVVDLFPFARDLELTMVKSRLASPTAIGRRYWCTPRISFRFNSGVIHFEQIDAAHEELVKKLKTSIRNVTSKQDIQVDPIGDFSVEAGTDEQEMAELKEFLKQKYDEKDVQVDTEKPSKTEGRT
jgi:hypothetical protein